MAEAPDKPPAQTPSGKPPEKMQDWTPFEGLRREVDRLFDDFRPFDWRLPSKVFGLDVLQHGIQDFADNVTRFLVLGRLSTAEDARIPDADKTTIVFALPNEPGALFKALSVFALRGIDLTKLESRPIPGRPWEYLFYADLNIGNHELKCGRALTHLAEFATSLRTLGSYKGVVRGTR